MLTKYSISPLCNLLIWVCLPLKRIVSSELTAWFLDNLSGIHHQRQMIWVYLPLWFVIKKSIWFIYFNRQQSSNGNRTKDQWTKSAFIKQLYTTTDRSLFWDHTVYYMYISYVNNTLNYYLRDISQIPYNNSPVIRNKLQTWMK